MTNYAKLLETVKENVVFLIFSLLIILCIYLVAFVFEKLIEKRCNIQFRSKNIRVKRLVVIGMFSAIAAILMFVEFPLWFAPGFYKLDFSELPAVIGAFMFGPTAGVVIEAVKILLKIVLKGTTTAFVGDFANFVVGCFFVVPSSAIYFLKKTKGMAIWGLVAGGLLMTIAGSLLNGFYLLPKFSELYGMPMETIVAMGTKVNGNINSVSSLVVLAVVPFNIIKSALVGIITMLVYKYISKLIKGQHVELTNK